MREADDTSLKARKAALYARVSSKEQEKEGFSIPAQLKALHEYARAHGLTVAREFIDVETAKQTGRTNFENMISFLKASPGLRVVLVEKTDRLYRNIKDWVTVDDLALEIHFVKENVVLSRDSRSSEKFMHGIKVLMAKNYIDNLSEEARKGMLEKAEQGIWPSCAPLGYRNVVGESGKKVIEPDPELAPMINRLFEWYATGRHSLRELTRMARREGMAFRKSANTISTSTVHKMLRSRIYMGEFEWAGRVYQGCHQPIVGRELWERVQAILDSRCEKPRRRRKHNFAFSGLIKGGHCGCALVGEIKKGQYVYYHCTGYKGRCPEPYVREEVLEERFGGLLKGLAFDAEILDWVREALRESHEDEKRHHEEAITRLQAEYRRLQARIDAMYVDKLDGRIETEFFERKSAEWRADQDRCQRLIEQHKAANQTYLEEGIRLLELAQSAHRLFLKQEPREKRRLLDFLVSNCTWKDRKLQATFRQPFDLLAETVATDAMRKAAGHPSSGLSENWLPGPDSNQRHGG